MARARSSECSDKQSQDASAAAYARWRNQKPAPSLPGETWRDVPSVPGYQASNLGRIRSRYTALKPRATITGHLTVNPSVAGKQALRAVHVMVCEAFRGPCPVGHECRHMDGDPKNNRPENLRWGTRLENQRDRKRHKTCNSGERNGRAQLTADQVRAIYARAITTESRAQIAKDFGVTRCQVGLIAGGFRWSSVTGAKLAGKRAKTSLTEKYAARHNQSYAASR